VDPAPATPAVPVDPSAPASLLTLDLRAHGEETAPSSRRITLPLAPPAALPSTPLASYPTTRGALSPATREAISRWLHAWHPCALARDDGHPLRWQAAPPPALHLSLAYRHDLWLHHRQTRLGLHGPGVALTAAWEPSGRLQLWGRFAQVTTLTDARGDLLAQFGATHLGLGAGLRVGDAALSLSLRFGLAAALTLNDFEATTDIDCKFFGPASARCGDIFVARAPLAWFGVTSGLALRWNPEPGWHVAGEVSLDAFVGAPSAVRELNYPLAFLLGFGASL
jgi:hypothetical protein